MRKTKIIAVTLCVMLLLPMLQLAAFAAGKYYLLWPTPGNAGLSSCYGDGRSHWAIDIAAPKGSKVIASAAGKVTAVSTSCTHNYGKNPLYNCCDARGNYILIRHTNPINGKTAETRYIHLTDVYVKVGQTVSAGELIGTVGSTGYSTGHHLDYKLYLDGVAVDPGPYLQIPSDLYFAGTTWSCCGPYISKLKSYNNTENGVGSGGGSGTESSLRLLSGYTYPILLLQGSKFSIGGTLTSNKKITYVEARITSPNGTVKYKATASPGVTSYNLSNLASSLSFNRLAEGYYAYELIAKDESLKSNYQLLYSPFTVSDKATIAPMAGYTYPTTLKPKTSFSIKGKIASINPLKTVTASVVTADGVTKLSQTRTTSSTTYDLSAMSSSLKFETLPEGTYYYRVTCTDNKGNTERVIDSIFYVSTKTGILGEISISGFFLAPSPGRTLKLETELEPTSAQYSIQWYADDQAIEGATADTFTPAFAHRNKSISVKIFGTGNYFGTLESAPTNKVVSLTGKQFTIDIEKQTVSPAPIGTTVNTLLDNLVADFFFTGIYGPDGKQLAGDDLLTNGCQLKSVIFGQTIVRYFIVIQGDPTGDNQITAEDARLALRGSAKIEKLNNYQERAADLNNDGVLTAEDARALLRVSARIESLPEL